MRPAHLQQTFDAALQSFATGRWAETEAACRAILAADPRDAAALHLLGTLAHKAGHLDDAVGLIVRAIALEPGVAAYHSNLGVVLMGTRRFDDAAAACRHAIALDSNLVDGHYNLGNALFASGRFDDAVDSFRHALTLRFDFPQAHNNLGNALKECGRFAEAAAAYRQALFFRPDYAHARSNLAGCLEESGRLDEAVAEHRRAVADAPASPGIHSNLILCLHYDPSADAATILRECRLWDERHARPHATQVAPHGVDRSPGRPLRIGYVSPDLRTHSIAFFVLALLEAHDRAAFHVTCYSTGTVTDDVTSRLRAASDAWCDLAGVGDDAAARRIRDDRIDILVDLSHHTRDNRLLLFARKPAPVQVTYLAFPGPTGLAAIDYRLTDATVDPPGDSDDGGERPVRLRDVAWCFAPIVEAPTVVDPPALRNGFVTFGSFGNLRKMAPDTLATWADLLRRLPTARLLLKSRGFRDPDVVDRSRALFATRGTDAGRVDLAPDDASLQRHLASHDAIDVALDTFPFNGLTTTCQALWMGVPVVTLRGARHASRMGATVLANAGLGELVAGTVDDYVERAVAVAADVPRLVGWRHDLRRRLLASPVMDAGRFARSLEDAYRTMWHDRCATSR